MNEKEIITFLKMNIEPVVDDIYRFSDKKIRKRK